MAKKSIKDLNLAGKRVLMRVDFNVPQDKQTGEITNTQRITAALPTIQYALEQGASVVLMSHLGRPDGRKTPKYTLKPVAAKLEELLGKPVTVSRRLRRRRSRSSLRRTPAGRSRPAREPALSPRGGRQGQRRRRQPMKADPAKVAAFRASLTKLGDVYVNDAFGTSHRAHSSVTGIDLPDKVAGFLVEKELAAFAAVLEHPRPPLLAILGGAKIADKIPLIRNLLDRADDIIIGGGMAFTFCKVIDGMEIGESLYDPAGAEIIPELVAKAKARSVNLHLPVDFITADKFASDAAIGAATVAEGIPAGWQGLDVGPKSRELFAEVIGRSKTIIWNGPPGVFEFDAFAGGTKSMALAIAAATANGATTVVGGGDTATAAKQFGVIDQVTHASTGGGASLELLEGKTLPGVASLNDE